MSAQVELQLTHGWAVLRLSGEIDTATRRPCMAAARQAIEAQVADVVVDLRQVTFMDSTGMSALAVLLRGGEVVPPVRLVGPQRPVHSALRLAGLLGSLQVVSIDDLPAEVRAVL